MKYSKVKIGDRVKSCLSGWGEVVDIFSATFAVNFESMICDFYFDGKTRAKDINPEIIDWEPNIKVWEPEYCFNAYLSGKKSELDNFYVEELRQVAVLAAYKKEFNPDFVADWGSLYQEKYCPYYCNDDNKWKVTSKISSWYQGVVWMDKEPTEELVKKLNIGEVVL